MTNSETYQVVDLDVLDFTFGGDAFGRMEDGKPVFVPLSSPESGCGCAFRPHARITTSANWWRFFRLLPAACSRAAATSGFAEGAIISIFLMQISSRLSKRLYLTR